MNPTETALLEALKTVVDPNTGQDLVSTKLLKNLRVDGADVSFDVELGYPARSQVPVLRQALIAAARGVAGVALSRDGAAARAIVGALSATLFRAIGATNHGPAFGV